MMNNLLGIYTMWYRDVLRFWYDKARMLSALLFPVFFLFMFGSGLQGSIGIMSGGKIIAEGTPAELKARVSTEEKPAPTLEDVFIELTGKTLAESDAPETEAA